MTNEPPRGCLCPCCGAKLDRPDPHRLVDFLPIAGQRRALLRTLVANFGREVPTEVLVDRLWSHDRDGGPLDASGTVSVMAYQLRRLLQPYGLTIRGKSAVGCYRLDWLDAPALREPPRTQRGPGRVIHPAGASKPLQPRPAGRTGLFGSGETY